MKNTTNKPILIFYKATILFKTGKNKDALSILESALKHFTFSIKQWLELDSAILQNAQVSDIIMKYKSNKVSKRHKR